VAVTPIGRQGVERTVEALRLTLFELSQINGDVYWRGRRPRVDLGEKGAR
jgi:hypothetical protein